VTMAKGEQPIPKNRLLAYLGRPDYSRLRDHLERVELPYRASLYRANAPIEFAYFLEEGVASLVTRMRNGAAVEVGTMGNEGMVGLPVVFGDQQSPTNGYMQVPGSGLRIRAAILSEHLNRNASLRQALLRYAHAFFNQVAQSAACAHLHALEQRACRWLLMTHDRMASDQFQLTQEFFAMMLGVRRAGVTVAAGALQKAGLIRYHRGCITILDRVGLEQRSCECYKVTASEFDRLLGIEPAFKDRNAFEHVRVKSGAAS